MKRRLSPRASPSTKRVSVPGSPSSLLRRSVQVDTEMNGKTEMTNISHDQIEVQSKNQITSSNQPMFVEENGIREKMVMEFDLNAIPDDPSSSDIPFSPQIDAVQGAIQASDTPIDVDELHSVIEIIDIGESPIRGDSVPFDAVPTLVQPFDNDIFVQRLGYSSNAPNHLNTNLVQSSYAPSDVELVDDRVLSLLLSRDAVQVQNQSTVALSRTTVLAEEHDINEGPSTVLTLAPYQLEVPLTDFFKLESRNDTTDVNLKATTEPERQKSSERKKSEESKESPFTCAVCWGPLKDETSTICGHIFCQICIKAAIKAQRKCPTCRRSLNRRNIHRVYLPTDN